MTLRPEIRFSSGFPDDALYGADECCEAPGGRNIAEALQVALRRLDYRVTDPVDGGDHGWELDIWWGRQRLWLQITAIDTDENYLIAEPFWLWPNMKLFRRFLADLHRILEADSRFSRIGWFPKGGLARSMPPAAGPFDT